MTLDEAKALYLKAKVAYYNDKPMMTDAKFDKLEDFIKAKAPKWAELKKTGVPVKDKKTEVALSHFMPSLPKVYPEATEKWLVKHPSSKYIVMDKLDGSSLQLTVTNGEPAKLVTRGNGTKGGDISFLLPHLKLPSKPNTKGTRVYRCEAVMAEKTFQKKWSVEAKGEKEGFDNSRNMVNGLLNRRDGHPALKDVHIVVLGQFDQPLLSGLANAAKAGFKVVPYAMIAASGPDILAERLKLRREHGVYEIDGLVVAPSTWNMVYTNADKPKGITAFKVNDMADAVTTKVEKIIWQVTGRRRIIPKLKIVPTRCGGVTVTHATVHNAKWMLDRGIGPGATVQIVRSGGVIPKIVGVLKKGKIQLPEIDHVLKGVHFYVDGASDETNERIDVLNIVKFLRTFGIEHMAATTAHKVYDAFRSPLDYIKLWHRKQLGTALVNAGVGEAVSAKITVEFDKAFSMKVIPMRQLMVATQCFDAGIGDRKLQMIEAHGISMNTMTITAAKPLAEQLMEVKGYSEKSTDLTIEGLKKFMRVLPLYKKHILIDGTLPSKPKKVVKGKLSGQLVSFTGYRDKLQEAAITKAGGEVVPFGSRTTLLLHKAGGKDSTKVDKAQAKGIKVAYFNELKV